MAPTPAVSIAFDNAHRQAPDERRAAPRYEPEPLVPVLFGHRDADTPAAGLIADVSLGGCRLIAAPNARPMLHWGDPFRLVVSYSEASREAGIEGLRLAAHVVRIVADARGLVVHCQFTVDGPDGEWRRLVEWVQGLANGDGSPV
jgi:hypothetical protein